MRKVFVIMTMVALAGSGLVPAQEKASFAGTWNFDEAKSDPAPAGRGGGGGGRGGGRGGAVATTLVIKQTAAEVTIESTTGQGSQTAVYKVGGESTVTMGRGEMKAKTSWDGDKLVIDGTQNLSTPNGDISIQRKDVISVAGNVLTIERTQTTQQGSQTRKLVYNKAS
ncbi:MAG: hypothetical protein HYZ58_03800 [Acidobacteria bacterium]|nr:hypothetical protein [Acidobacteriota bacterium]